MTMLRRYIQFNCRLNVSNDTDVTKNSTKDEYTSLYYIIKHELHFLF